MNNVFIVSRVAEQTSQGTWVLEQHWIAKYRKSFPGFERVLSSLNFTNHSTRQIPKMPSETTTEQAPLGPVCCVFTDIINSTALWEHAPMAMKISLTKHDRLIRDELNRFGGYEVRSTGDGFHLVFAAARSAMQFSLAVQEGMENIEWPEAICEYRRQNVDCSHKGLSVSIGINFGQPFSVEINPTDNRLDYFGPMINKTARIQGEAGEGRIAISDAFIAQLELQLELERTVWTVLKPTTFNDLDRIMVLREILLDRPFGLSFKGHRFLKGIKSSEYITVISLKTSSRRSSLVDSESADEAVHTPTNSNPTTVAEQDATRPRVLESTLTFVSL